MDQFSSIISVLNLDPTGSLFVDHVDHDPFVKNTVLITLMHANNEVGTIQPIAAVSQIAREHGILFHTDAAQSVGKVPTRVGDLGVDLLTVAGHKLYAPKGIGALYVRRGISLEPLVHGAGHERGLRAGTENTPSIVGLGAACEIAAEHLDEAALKQTTLRDRLYQDLCEQVKTVQLNGHPTERLPNTLNISFVGRDSSLLLPAVPEIAASTGSACHAGETEPSAVLLAMGVPRDVALGAVRLSLGRWTTAEEIDRTVEILARQISSM